jgi:DNA repair protein RadC
VIIGTASDAAALFGPLFADAAAAGETLAVAHLDSERRLIGLVSVDAGARDHVDLPVRRILEDALRLGSAGLVLAHNHPSGDAQPSWDDVESTRELADTAARLGIRLYDHLIFAGEELCSLRSLGLL